METHLREVPALNEVSGYIAGSFAMYNRGDVVPRHPWCSVAINEVYGNGKAV